MYSWFLLPLLFRLALLLPNVIGAVPVGVVVSAVAIASLLLLPTIANIPSATCFHRFWLLAAVGVPDVTDVSCAAVDPAVGDVLMAVDVLGFPAVAKVFSVDAVPTYCYLCTFCYKVFQCFWRPSLLSLASLLFSAPGVVGVSAVVSVPVWLASSCF
jgi:hypothetical protein